MKNKMAGPQFIRFFLPVVETLQELGGSGKPSEIINVIAQKWQVSDEEREAVLPSGQLRFDNQIHWARFYLVKGGYLDSSKRGVWTLTDKINQKPLRIHDDAYKLFKDVQKQIKGEIEPVEQIADENANSINAVVDETPAPSNNLSIIEEGYRVKLLQTLLSLSPNGFERLCQRLLREAGFEQVIVTGRTGDGGIDGHGILQINPFVSFKVLFQCKRYSGAVSSSQVRDFRGAMAGRADKGIIITTGKFTADAQKEAVRDGVPPIELVDGDTLLQMFENLELGLIPRTTYDINTSFFEDFK